MKFFIGSIFITLLLTGCSSMKPQNFKESQQKLNLFDYFEGATSPGEYLRIDLGIFADNSKLILKALLRMTY